MLSRQAFMWISNLFKAVKSPERRLALLVAMAGDGIQILRCRCLPAEASPGGHAAGRSLGRDSYPIAGMALGFPPHAAG